jgi:hypothetical protein
MTSRSALNLYRSLLETVIRSVRIGVTSISRFELTLWHCSAPYAFFVNTDVGTITNRFGQDMELVDMTLPLAALNAVFCKPSPTTNRSAVRELMCQGLSCDRLHHGCDTIGDCCKIPCRHHPACHDHRIFPAEILPAHLTTGTVVLIGTTSWFW